MIDVTVKGLANLQKDVKAENKRQEKALETSVRVEGFRLRRVLKKEIRDGAPGGRRFAGLSMIRRIEYATYRKTGRLRTNRPLSALARTVGYKVDRNPFQFAVGFVPSAASSVTWRRLAKKQQEGFSVSADAPHESLSRWHTYRSYFASIGSYVHHSTFGGRKTVRRNVFFLRKSTKRLRTPGRPIIDPFWQAHESESRINIRQNFRLKMQGKRI